MKNEHAQFGSIIKRARKQKAITQAQMSKILKDEGLKVSKSYLSAFEIGRALPNQKIWQILSKELDLDPRLLARYSRLEVKSDSDLNFYQGYYYMVRYHAVSENHNKFLNVSVACISLEKESGILRFKEYSTGFPNAQYVYDGIVNLSLTNIFIYTSEEASYEKGMISLRRNIKSDYLYGVETALTADGFPFSRRVVFKKLGSRPSIVRRQYTRSEVLRDRYIDLYAMLFLEEKDQNSVIIANNFQDNAGSSLAKYEGRYLMYSISEVGKDYSCQKLNISADGSVISESIENENIYFGYLIDGENSLFITLGDGFNSDTINIQLNKVVKGNITYLTGIASTVSESDLSPIACAVILKKVNSLKLSSESDYAELPSKDRIIETINNEVNSDSSLKSFFRQQSLSIKAKSHINLVKMKSEKPDFHEKIIGKFQLYEPSHSRKKTSLFTSLISIDCDNYGNFFGERFGYTYSYQLDSIEVLGDTGFLYFSGSGGLEKLFMVIKIPIEKEPTYIRGITSCLDSESRPFSRISILERIENDDFEKKRKEIKEKKDNVYLDLKSVPKEVTELFPDISEPQKINMNIQGTQIMFF